MVIITVVGYVLIGAFAFVLGVYCWIVATRLFKEDNEVFRTKSAQTGGFGKAILGELDEHPSSSSGTYSQGFKLNTQSGELKPCRQLSNESVKFD